MRNPSIIDLMFHTDKHLMEGRELTPSGSPTPVREPLPMDYFQQRIAALPRTAQETGMQDIFQNSLPAVPDIREYLRTANLKLIHGFPREAADLPCISITLGNEDESQYLAGQKQHMQGADGKVYDFVGSDWAAQYNINVITPNYDETVIWYFLIKRALTIYRPHIEAYGMREQKMSWMDVEPAPEYLQAGLFVYQRSCILSCVKDEDVPVESQGFTELGFGVEGFDQAGDGGIIPEGV